MVSCADARVRFSSSRAENFRSPACGHDQRRGSFFCTVSRWWGNHWLQRHGVVQGTIVTCQTAGRHDAADNFPGGWWLHC